MKITARQYAETLLTLTEDKSGKALELVMKDFVEMLSDRHERSRWREIARSFEAAWKRRYGTASVRVETAHALSEAARSLVEKQFPKATIEEVVQPELIGGARFRIDDRVLDASAAGQLNRLRQHLTP